MGGCFRKFSVSKRTNGKFRSIHRKSAPKVSAETKQKVTAFLEEDYTREMYTSVPKLEDLLSCVPKEEDILLVYYESGFNLLQKCVAENNLEAVKLILSRDPDVNNSPCSLPLHIACLKGYIECAQYLIEHGARMDIEARMCWPGPHTKGCPGAKNESKTFHKKTTLFERSLVQKEGRDKRQNALFYTLDGGQSEVLNYLLDIETEESQGISKLGPLLEVASAKEAWSCCSILLERKAEEIDTLDSRTYLDSRPINSEMTLFHVLFNIVSRPAEFTLKICKALLYNGLVTDVDTLDFLGNTPIHSIIIRYAFEETRSLWLRDYKPWGQVETKEMIRLLLRGGTTAVLNQPGNSTLSLVIRHVNDWKFIYDLLNTILEVGASPVIKDREGHCPLMACIIKLINDDLVGKFDTMSKWYYTDCLGILCSAGANPNCEIQPSLTPLHALVFTVAENFSSSTDQQMVDNCDFIRSILDLFFHFGLDANAATTSGSPNVFRGILKLVEKSRCAIDLEKVYELVMTLIEYGVDPNTQLQFPPMETSFVEEGNPFLVAEHSYLLAHMFAALAEKQELLTEAEESVTELLYLVYSSMDHKKLLECLDLIYTNLPATLPDSPLHILCDIVIDMYSRPRTLQNLTRIAINESLDRKPGLYACQLPLPKGIQYYLKYGDP